jgi:hypothetical protein
LDQQASAARFHGHHDEQASAAEIIPQSSYQGITQPQRMSPLSSYQVVAQPSRMSTPVVQMPGSRQAPPMYIPDPVQ